MALRKSGRRLAAALGFAVAGVVGITVGLPAQALSPEDLATLRQEYRRPPPRPVANAALVGLGRALFFEPRLSASGTTACASCHFPALGWGVTDAKSRNDSGKLTSRKSQPLIGLGHAGDAPVGWDGRSPTLEAQAKASIETGSMSMRDTDAPVKVEAIVARIRADPAYAAQFAAALPGASVDIDAIVTAIAAFERTLEPGPAPFDAWVEGDEAAIPAAAKRGFALFAGQANCFACHGGWRFTDDRFHDIGTTTTDPGRGRVDKDALMQFAFKTPTLRSVALRPPYMHNGSAPTLLDAVKHYETGGLDRPSRSPLMQPIVLSEAEREDLVAFLETLTGDDAAAGR
ncbi:MAG: cytochrome-c peroxidase [Microvirga sp.]